MKTHRPKRSGYSRRQFIAAGALAAAPVLGAKLFGIADCRAAGNARSAKSYQLVPNWPGEGCPRVQSRGIDADSKGRIYVAGDAEHPILMLSAEGKYLGDWGQGILTTPHGLRVHQDTVWVHDLETHLAHQFTLDGEPIRSFGTKGTPGDGPNQFNRPTDFAFAPDGAIYISDGYLNTRVVCREPDGTVRKIWGEKGDGPSQFDLVHAIAIDRRRRVLVADRSNRRIQIFDLKGDYLTQWDHVGTPYGLYACDDGSIFLCGLAPDGERFRVAKLDGNGKVLDEFGQTGDGPGQFLMAHSIYVDKDHAVFVADGKANRVQKFALA